MKRAFVVVLFVAALRLRAADFEAGIGYINLEPIAGSTYDGGELDIATGRGFEATAEVFFTPRVSTHFAAQFVNPAVILMPAGGGDVDLGTLGIDVYSASARYHFRPDARWAPFAGGGVAAVMLGNLDDQFGDAIEVRFGNETAPFGEAGVRYRARSNVFFILTASYMPLEIEPDFVRNDSSVQLPEKIELDPVTVSVSASWRF